MKKSMIKFVQQQLNNKGINVGKVDGDAGKKTMAGLAKVDGLPKDWSKKRKLVGFIQLLAKEHDVEVGDVDGYLGPQTEHAYDVLQRKLVENLDEHIWRPEELSNENPNHWPSQSSTKSLEKNSPP